MKAAKRKKLESLGWKVGSATDFLSLTDEEAAYIELKLTLSNRVKAIRVQQGLTQIELATLIDSSQSRVAKMETGDQSVSLDLLIKTLLALGINIKEIGKIITKAA